MKNDLSQKFIRHCDNSGKLLGSFVSWSSLNWPTSFVAPTPVFYSVLVSFKDRVGWYSPASGAYIEFDPDGAITRQFSTAPHTREAACEDGELFANTKTGGEHRGWAVFNLDRERNEWTLIPRDEQWGALAGCDGQRVLSMTDFHTLPWLQPSTK